MAHPLQTAHTHPHKKHVHTEPAHVVIFIQQTLPAAKLVKTKWGIPIAVLLAQAAQESGWGRTVVQNAYFGIKGKSPDGSSVKFGTTEVINGKVVHETDAFRAYTDFADSADDYGRFLNENPRYKAAFLYPNDAEKFVHELVKAGYATDPHYAKSIMSIIHSHKLDQYDK